MSKRQKYVERLLQNLEERVESFIHADGIIKFKLNEKENKKREYEIKYKYELRILSYIKSSYFRMY